MSGTGWTLPPKDHPIWKILQGAISLAGMIVLVGWMTLHHHMAGGGVDHDDVEGVGSGVIGVGAGGALLLKLVKGLADSAGS